MKDRVSFRRPRHVPGLELVCATYRARSFPIHSHPEYVIGAVTEGAERLAIRGADRLAASGSTLFIHPDEPHANASVGDQRLGYRVFYIPAPVLADWLRTDDGGRLPGLAFDEPVRRSRELFGAVLAAHRALFGAGDALEQQSAFVALTATLARWSRIAPPPGGLPETRLLRVKDYLDSHFRLAPSLADLAEVAGLSPFYLLRSFKGQFGLAPAAYRNQLRVMEARSLLRRGEPIAEVAAELGFVDQSHLTRHFQRVMGTTPARYAQQ